MDIPGTSAADELPSSQVLFSDQELSEHETGEGITPQETDTPSQEDNRTKRKRRRPKLNLRPAQNATSDDSSDYEPPPRKLSLQEVFDNNRNKRKLSKKNYREKVQKKKTREKYLQTEKKQPRKVPAKKKALRNPPLVKVSSQKQKQESSFPFTSSKRFPLKLCLSYEQAVLDGFLSNLKKIKFEKHLRNSLNTMGVPEEVEKGNLEAREHWYLDDDESISPISDSGDDGNETEGHDAVIVENSSFILDCKIPCKKEWRIMGRRRKRKSSKGPT